MTGNVNADLEPSVRLTVHDAGGQPRELEAVIDTGFNGFLTLPPALIAAPGTAVAVPATGATGRRKSPDF